MRTFIFLLCTTVFSFTPNNVLSQNASINIEKDKLITVDEVFRIIKKQTDYRFIYESDMFKGFPKVSVKRGTIKANQLLKLSLSKGNFDFNFIDENTVVIKKISNIQQEVTISGKIVDENGIPLSGMTIYVTNNKPQGENLNREFLVRGTTSDLDGNFSLLTEVGYYLVASGIGYSFYSEVIVAEKLVYNITLEEQISALDEVVVVGYGSTKRKDVTGSVSSVSAKEIVDMPVASVDNALVGKASGVQIIKADGSPGGAVRIKVRGGTSLLGGNDPLYVIDGVPVTVTSNNYIFDDINVASPIEAQGSGESFNNTVSGAFARGLNNLAGLNLNDIETIDILKDASATAIYGSKAANGVVIITTKGGSYNQKVKIDLNVNTSFSIPITQDVMNAQQFRDFLTTAAQNTRDLQNAGNNPFLFAGALPDLILDSPETFFGEADTDWVDLVTRTAKSTRVDFSISGGSQNTKYYTSLAHAEQEGTIINTGFKRITSVSKLDTKFSHRLSLSSKIGLSFSQNDLTNGVFAQALLARPDFSVFDDNGDYTVIDTEFSGIQNPVALTKIANEAKSFNLNAFVALEYKILEDLKFRSSYAIDLTRYDQTRFAPSFVDLSDGNGRFFSPEAEGSESTSKNERKVFENYFTWDKEFDENNKLNIIAGSAWEVFDTDFFSASGQGYPDDVGLINLGSAVNRTRIAGGAGGNSLLSFYTRANYNYRDKYLFTFTGRADASSKFAPKNRWAIFPSGAIAWRVSEENFLKDSNWIDEIKLRASLGLVGTQNIGDNLYRTLYAVGQYAGNPTISPSVLGNNDLKWEETFQQDFALDYSFFKNRVAGTIGYYSKSTDGQLINISIAPSSGFSNLVTNLATIDNEGWEIDLRLDIIRSKNFSWSSNLNLSTNKSKVTNIDGDPFSDPFNRDVRSVQLGTSIVKEGEPLGLLFGRLTDGIIDDQDELDAYVTEAFDKLGFVANFFFGDATIGSTKYIIDEEEFWKRGIIGNANPDFFGGFSNTFRFKNFSIYTLFNFTVGNDLIWQRDVTNRQPGIRTVRNFSPLALGGYSPDNTNTTRPLPLFGASSYLTDQNVYDASFIKLKQLTLNYSFSQTLMDKLKISNASIYLSASNLFTITDYPGIDPEVSDDPSSIIGGGRDTDNFPTSTTISLGFKVGL
ncbi:SusC/RagA family TonB-linked outer membrane protein [Seonamhaeicola sp.]|uniref:SusC/RagA family TonB-linked outer membrane protein n=1 Tax=Seonamhaeicola sp. TaxID=1912245 RepID=UPI002639D5D8|nr:SusC/RagA family TonB-linked outer membrane protein [Seonamhaeicola sp.]